MTTTTHSSHPMGWYAALTAWLAAARAPQAGAPVLDEGALDGATGPEDLMTRAQTAARLYLADEQASAAVTGARVWGATVPRVDDGGVVWGAGASRCRLRPVAGAWAVDAWVVEIECDGDPYGTPDAPCACLRRADAARHAGAAWRTVRADVLPAVRAARDLAVL